MLRHRYRPRVRATLVCRYGRKRQGLVWAGTCRTRVPSRAAMRMLSRHNPEPMPGHLHHDRCAYAHIMRVIQLRLAT